MRQRTTPEVPSEQDDVEVGRGDARTSTVPAHDGTAVGAAALCTRTVRAAWSSVSDQVAFRVTVDPGAEPFVDNRVVASITAVLHAAADRAHHAVAVVVGADGTVAVHDDGDGPTRTPDVLTTAARSALRAIAADLVVERSALLGGTCCTIVRPDRPRAA